MLLSALLKNRFKQKFGYDIERLFLYVWPVIICMPIFLSTIYLSLKFSSIIMLPVFALMFSLVFGMILPFADYLKPVFDRAAKKLPPRIVRYEKMVTEMVEDRAKKGKFTEVTSKKVIKEKVKWNYKNRFGVAAVSLIAAVLMTLSISFAGGFNSKIVSNRVTPDNYQYSGSLAYVYDTTGGSADTYFEIKDRQAYNYIQNAISGFEWNDGLSAYKKSAVVNNVIDQAGGLTAPSVANPESGRVIYERSRETGGGRIEGRLVLKISGARQTARFTFNHGENASDTAAETEVESTAYELKNNGADLLTVYFPIVSSAEYDYISISYDAGEDLEFVFEEQLFSGQVVNFVRGGNNADILALEKMFGGSTEVDYRTIMVFRTSVTV
jgi:hypothetical protein